MSVAGDLRGELDALTAAVGRLGESDSPARVSTRILHGIDRVIAGAMAERDSLLHERDRLAADLARVTTERDSSNKQRDWLRSENLADSRRCHKLIWIAEKHIPRDALAAYYAEKNAADPQNTQGPEVGS